jgi:hypothetical protein
MRIMNLAIMAAVPTVHLGQKHFAELWHKRHSGMGADQHSPHKLASDKRWSPLPPPFMGRCAYVAEQILKMYLSVCEVYDAMVASSNVPTTIQIRMLLPRYCGQH